MEYLWIYLSGVVVYLVFVVWFNYQFDHNHNLKNVTSKEWKEDLRCGDFAEGNRLTKNNLWIHRKHYTKLS